MDSLLVVAALITVLVGLAHSFLGERYILVRLFRRDLPKLFGSDLFTKRTLRFAWHITTLTWWGLAAVMIAFARSDGIDPRSSALVAISVTFALSGLVSLLASRGRHLSWIAFFAIAVLLWAAAAR